MPTEPRPAERADGLVRSLYDAFAHNDLRALQQALHTDVWCWEPPTFPFGGLHIGRRAVATYLRRSRALWATLTCELLDLDVAGDNVLAVVRHAGISASTGDRMEALVADIVTVQDGKVVALEGFADIRQARHVLAQRVPASGCHEPGDG